MTENVNVQYVGFEAKTLVRGYNFLVRRTGRDYKAQPNQSAAMKRRNPQQRSLPATFQCPRLHLEVPLSDVGSFIWSLPPTAGG